MFRMFVKDEYDLFSFQTIALNIFKIDYILILYIVLNMYIGSTYVQLFYELPTYIY